MKYNKHIIERLCELVSTADFTIEDCCKQVGITKDTFYKWKKNKSDFSDSLKRAEQKRLEAFKSIARSGLAKLLDVYEYEEITTEYQNDKNGKPQIKSRKIVKKKIMPNPLAVIFTLTNMDPDNFKHKQDITSGGEPIGQVIIELPSNGRDDSMVKQLNK